MTEIRGKYLYDLTTLKTVGKATDRISQEEKQDYNNIPGHCISTGGYSGILFSLLKGGDKPEKMGTVEQLSFEQMITLFMQGDMVVEELKIGLESKGVTDVTSTVQDGMTTVTFTYDNKVFTLKCATEAAVSQIDDKTAEITDDSITATSLIEESGYFTLYEQVPGYSEPEAGGLVFKHMEPNIENPVSAYLSYVFMPAVNEQLGYNFQYVDSMFSKLTDEDKKYINEHPEIFHYHFEVGANGQFTGSAQIDRGEVDRFALENGSYQMTPEEYYSYLVTQFAKCGVIYRSSHDYGCGNACELYVQYAGDGNVKFTDDTVELLMADFKRWPDLNSGMIQLLGVTAQDDKETIWKKIEFFCKSLGSEDGKTISAEKLYLLLGGKTYDEVVDDMEIARNSRESYKEIQTSLFGSAVDCPSESELFALNLNYKKDAPKPVTKINESDIPVDGVIHEIENPDSEQQRILAEFYYQVGDTNKYLLKPELVKYLDYPSMDEVLDRLDVYLYVCDELIKHNLATGNFDVPLQNIEDLLRTPDSFGLDNKTLTIDNYFNFFESVLYNEYSHACDFNTQLLYNDGFLFDYLSESNPRWGNDYQEIGQKQRDAFVEAFASGNMSEDVLLMLMQLMEIQISGYDVSTEGSMLSVSDGHGSGVDIQLPIPETYSQLYTLEELDELGIGRSEVEVAIRYDDGRPTKYRLKTENKTELRAELMDAIKAERKTSFDKIQTVNPDALFANSGNSVNADYLLGAEILYTNDDSVKKLVLTIQEAIEQYSEYLLTDADKKEFVNRILTNLNHKVGIENKIPPVLTKNALEKLNELNIFDKINEIINSDLFITLTTNPDSLDIPDGILYPENFSQGNLGDCGLVAAIVSIVNTDTGRKLLQNTIQRNGDMIVFNFQGVGLTDEFSLEELYDFCKNEKHSMGDIDIIAIEYAFTRLVQDIKNGKYGNIFVNKFHCGQEGRPDLGTLFGILSDDVIEALVPDDYALKTNESSIVDLFNKYPCCGVASLPPGVTTTLIDGSTFNSVNRDADGDGNPEPHDYAIVAMTDETITLVNPWDPTEEFTMTWENFLELGRTDVTPHTVFTISPIYDKEEFEKLLHTTEWHEPTLADILAAFDLLKETYNLENLQQTFAEIFGYDVFNNPDSATTGPAATAPAHTQEIRQETPNTQENTVNDVILKFAQGNMTYNEAVAKLNAVGINITTTLRKDDYDATQQYFEFKYNGLEYCVACNTEASENSSDNKTVTVWSQAEIEDQNFTTEELDKYFQGVAWKEKASGALYYRAKIAWPEGVTTPAQLKTYLVNASAPKTETETETPPANNVETDNTEDDFYASLAKKIETAAIELGYEKGDDGNYYFNQGNNTYLCLWNYWTNSFDKYLVETAEDDEVQLDVNSKGDFQASENTLESLFAESILIAQKYEMTPTEDTGVFELNNERYVFDIQKRMFVKEVDAVKNNTRTWGQLYYEALELALKLGYIPSSIAFCIFKDNEGNHFKYDADEQKFVEYNA